MEFPKIRSIDSISKFNVSGKAMKATDELVSTMIKEPFGTIHSIYEMIENADRTNESMYEANGLSLDIDTGYKFISVNGACMNGSESIVVGLTNGYRFCFSIDDIIEVRGMLNMFNPEDIRRILSAIAQVNYKLKKLVEIEKDRIYMGEAAEKKENDTVQHEVVNQKNVQEDTFKKMAADTVSGSFLYHINPDEVKQIRLEKEQEMRKEDNDKRYENNEITEEMLQRLITDQDEL